MKTKELMAVTIDIELLNTVKQMSIKEQRTLSSMVSYLLKKAINKRK